MSALEYRLTVGGQDVSCDTLAAWTVTYGRTDPDSQPDPGRGQWTLVLDGGDRGPVVRPRAPVVFEVRIDGGGWLPVATMLVADVQREFGWVGGLQRNRLTVNAEGTSVALQRALMPGRDSYGNPVPPNTNPYDTGERQTEGERVRQVVVEAGVPTADRGRQASNHDVNDRPLAGGDGSWPAAAPVDSTAWTTVQRTAALPAAVQQGFEYEVDATVTSDVPVMLRLLLDGRVWPVSWQFPAAGSHRIHTYVWPWAARTVAVQALAYDPKAVVWSAADTITNAPHHWPDVTPTGTRWRDLMPARRGTVRVTEFDMWRMGAWAYGDGHVEFRNISDDEYRKPTQTRLDYIRSIGTAFRSALWELRDGTVTWTTRHYRSASPRPAVDLDSCEVLAGTRSSSSLSQVVNRVKYYWGWADPGVPDSKRPDPKEHFDATSEGRYGTQEWSNPGPVHSEGEAEAIAQYVVRGHAEPHEDLPTIELLPLEKLPGKLVDDLLRLQPSGVVAVNNTPAGWVKSPTWWGFLEGTTLTGSRGETRMEISLSDYESQAAAAQPTGGTP